MTERSTASGERAASRVAGVAVVIVLALTYVYCIGYYSDILAPDDPGLVDFDAFHIVGQMVWSGELADAYDVEKMFAAQRRYADVDGFMPWTYPPPYDLFVAALALLSRGAAYAVFAGASLVAFLVLLRRLAGDWFGYALLYTAPALLITLLIGQNGFMIGALVAWFCLLSLNRAPVAGVPLGLMVIKPHLAVGIGVLTLTERRWRTAAIAIAVGIAACLAATVALGPGVWIDFLGATREAKDLLAEGKYPLFRMTSAYAALFKAGAVPGLAMAGQAVVALAALAAIVAAARSSLPPRLTLGVAVLASPAISPYNYDYDLTLMTVGLGLVLEDVVRRIGAVEKLLLLALSWLATGWGLWIFMTGGNSPAPDTGAGHAGYAPVSLGFLGYALLMLLLWSVLRRPQPAGVEAAPA